MPLHLIKGPLNSGRTGRIRELVAERERAGPVIVAPTGDARYELEAELCGERGAAIGPYVTDFTDLATAVALAAGATVKPRASVTQRRYLVAEATARTKLGILAASASRPGFTVALERLFGELRSAAVEPETGHEDRYLDELLRVYAAYLEGLERAGLTDQAGLIDAAATALKTDPDSWAARPVFMHGFDDLSPDQLRLVEALAGATEVTISLTYEDRRALRARSRLLGLLEDAGGTVIEEMPPVPKFTPNRLLFHLERNFGETEPPPAPAGEGGLHVMYAAGERGEAEMVAAEIKQLIVSGTPASRIAIALRTPNRQGPELARALGAAGIPVALETEIGVTGTATGQALADLAAAALASDAEALVRLCRGVGVDATVTPDLADALEWLVRRGRQSDTDAALAELKRRHDFALPELAAVRRAAAAGAEALADRLAEFVTEAAARAGGATEARAARLIATTAADLAAMTGDADELLRILLTLEVRTWAGPIGERVRIASPYTLRTTRVDHLFVCSLQEGEFPRRGGDGPFLSEAQRAALGLVERADTEAEEMYLFQVCLSLPEHGLWLSARTTDAEGGLEQPSPFLDQVITLAGDRVGRARFDLSDLAPPPERATSADELARALLLSRRPAASEFLADSATAAEIENRIEQAIARHRLAARPRPLQQAAVLEELGRREEFGATGLEAFLRYPYHWFIGRELVPEPLDRDDQHLTDGSLVHAVLQRLYGDSPDDGARPGRADLDRWQRRCGELLEEAASEAGLSREFVPDRIRLRRMAGFLRNFLEAEAENAEVTVRPAMFEASFGGEDGERPALSHDGWALRGTIDRVDLTPDGSYGLLQDYKYSAGSVGLAKFESEGSLQIPLYLAALQRLWGIRPLGGIYRPLRAARDASPRGMLSTRAVDGPLAGMRYTDSDVIDEAEMMLLIEEALERAGEAVAGIRAGKIDGEPLEKAFKNPAWAAIDRRTANLAEGEREP